MLNLKSYLEEKNNVVRDILIIIWNKKILSWIYEMTEKMPIAPMNDGRQHLSYAKSSTF